MNIFPGTIVRPIRLMLIAAVSAVVFSPTVRAASENAKPAVIVNTDSEPVAPGKFEPNWKSLTQYEVPEWYRNAKFSIWAHWGPQCQPEEGGWYARTMYREGSSDYLYHLAHYGHPSKFGFKDVINTWKAEKWDPEALMKVYKRAGAQYFFALGNHHDNFDLWDSKYQPWNAVNMGPKEDLIAGWEKAARDQGLRFGASLHAARAWAWYEPSQGSDEKGPLAGVPYDGNLTKADGKGLWWEGYDPQDLYAQQHPHSVGWKTADAINNQATYNHGASMPSQAYCDKFYNRTIDLINHYHPDMLYFDDASLPLWPASDAGLKIAAHLYNTDMQQHGGKLEALMFTKYLNDFQRKAVVWDYERGIAADTEPFVWQTDTCIGHWHYNRHVYEQKTYKSAKTVVQMLADIVSKNGNLLLNIPLRGDGTYDELEAQILQGIGDWMDVNRESIFDRRPWKIFGEGPASANVTNNGRTGFNEGKGKPFTSEDVRFTAKGDVLYAIILEWPGDSSVTTIHSLAVSSPELSAGQTVTQVSLLGDKSNLEWSQKPDGVSVKMPSTAPCRGPVVLKLTLSSAK